MLAVIEDKNCQSVLCQFENKNKLTNNNNEVWIRFAFFRDTGFIQIIIANVYWHTVFVLGVLLNVFHILTHVILHLYHHKFSYMMYLQYYLILSSFLTLFPFPLFYCLINTLSSYLLKLLVFWRFYGWYSGYISKLHSSFFYWNMKMRFPYSSNYFKRLIWGL